MAIVRTVSHGWGGAERRALEEFDERPTPRTGGPLATRLAMVLSQVIVTLGRALPHRVARSDDGQERLQVLIVRLDELGDVILGSPLFDALRRAWPDARITLVVQPAPAALYAGDSALDEVIVFRPPHAKWLRPLAMPVLAFLFARRRLAPMDLAIQPRWGVDANFAAWIAYFSGARRRLGFSSGTTPRKRVLNAGLDSLYTDLIDGPRVALESERVNDVLRAVGLPSTDLRPHSAPHAVQPHELPTPQRGVTRVVVGVGGGHSALKVWPAAYYGELMSVLAADRAIQFILLGDQSEQALAQEAIAHSVGADIVDSVGRTSLSQAAAILDASALFVGNDTGLLHLAAARGVRTVGVFGPSLPAIFAPAGDAHIAVWNALPCNPYARAVATTRADPPTELTDGERCATCVVGTHACMRALPVATVRDACVDQLDARGTRSSALH